MRNGVGTVRLNRGGVMSRIQFELKVTGHSFGYRKCLMSASALR